MTRNAAIAVALALLAAACSPSARKFLAADWQGATYNGMSVEYFFEEEPRGHVLYVMGGKNFLYYQVDLEKAIRMAKADLASERCGGGTPVVLDDVPASTGPHMTVFACR